MMNFRTRMIYIFILDSLIVSFAIFIAHWLVYPYSSHAYNDTVIIITALCLLIFHHVYAIIYNLYNKVWAYASVGELLAIFKAVTLTILTAGVIQFLINDFVIYRRALLVTWMLHIILIGGSRFAWRVFRDRYISKANGVDKKRTLIVGAGAAGAMIARQLNNEHNHSNLYPVAFVDDSPSKQRMQIYGVPVVGKVKHIPEIVEQKQIEHIVIAIPSLKKSELQKIVAYCNKTKAKVQMLPKIEDLAEGRVSVSQLKNVEVEDLLGRDPVELDIRSIESSVTGETVMVTGAGGSIGSELCRQLMPFKPKRLLLVGHGEYSIYEINNELKKFDEAKEVEIIPLIGDIKDCRRMEDIVGTYRPKIIYHAAAHKHVPLMEENPHEAVKNNVIGTKNVAEVADKFGVDTFVLVSTDKAVNPTNVMGATKRIAEMIIQTLNETSKTKYVAVRFGNVLGSRGSVIPLFKKQIAEGGPVTVTDERMTRYFMTIPEASRLVIQAGSLAKGGEIFVLDMGEPVKIVDLAKNLIKLSGYEEDEIEIVFTGIRPGEKLYEELLNENEIMPGQVYEKIYVGRTVPFDPGQIDELIEHFLDYDNKQLKDELMNIVYANRGELVTAK